MRRNFLNPRRLLFEKYATVEAYLDVRGRPVCAAAESRAIGYGGDTPVSDAIGLSPQSKRTK